MQKVLNRGGGGTLILVPPCLAPTIIPWSKSLRTHFFPILTFGPKNSWTSWPCLHAFLHLVAATWLTDKIFALISWCTGLPFLSPSPSLSLRTLRTIRSVCLSVWTSRAGRWKCVMRTSPACGPTASRTAWPASRLQGERESQRATVQSQNTDWPYSHQIQTGLTDTKYRLALQTANTDWPYSHQIQTGLTDTKYRLALQIPNTDRKYNHQIQTGGTIIK